MCKVKFTKFLSVLLSVLILSSIVFSTNAFAETSVSSDFVKKETTLDENRIYLYSSDETYYEIAGFSETVNVENITKLTLEDGETDKIGKEAFKGNPYIEEIFLDNKDFINNSYLSNTGLRSIGESAFENCTGLKKVKLYFTSKLHYFNRINLIEICSSAFKGCTSLEEFEVPTSVVYIDSKAFADCTSLKKVAIYEHTTEIADDAFENCNNLTIYGNNNSTAHKYAKEKNIPFVSIDFTTDVVFDLYDYNIMYMTKLLQHYPIENNYLVDTSGIIPNTNYQLYYFQDYWSDELNTVFYESRQILEDPFATENELLTAVSKAQEAIHKAELIEELGRLIEPQRIEHYSSPNPPIYHHTGACSYCLKVMELFAGYSSFLYPSKLSYESDIQYSNLKEQITERLERGNLSTNEAYSLLYLARLTIDNLITVDEEYLINSIDILNNKFDFSLYTSETVSEVKECISQAEEVIGKGYYYQFFFSEARTNLELSSCKLRLISFEELEKKHNEYYNLERYKYTWDSFENLNSVLNMAYYNVISPYNSLNGVGSSTPQIPYPYQTQYEAHMCMNNDMMVAELEKLTEAYNALELIPLGDVNRDGINSVTDVIYTLKSVVGTTCLYEESQYFADMNSDGKVTVLDAVLLQRDILEMS